AENRERVMVQGEEENTKELTGIEFENGFISCMQN
nr:RecName: Full=Peptide 9797 [Tityus stigmurus]